ncbi:PREDICTED: uncharacterized protein LOC109170421 isoform X1 [Ipomoea nil]|uniref:uncharacterized protein LOC109170421 isoform X1 n=1 Tax=Ipomoea nil TaxID=35883 RepID=UPI000901F611|nr:PREDICTED: uncharacterized protein LOC109170421 isoform X1 [Ipomoea nil]
MYRNMPGGPVLIPGFFLWKALQPVLPIFLQGLTSGSAELRKQAALGLGELIEVTSEQALKEFVIPITGTVRSCAAIALRKLSALTIRIDPLVGDLLSALQHASDVGIREASLIAFKGVIKHAGKSRGKQKSFSFFSECWPESTQSCLLGPVVSIKMIRFIVLQNWLICKLRIVLIGLIRRRNFKGSVFAPRYY